MGMRLIPIIPFEDFRGELKKILRKSNLDKGLDIKEAYYIATKVQ